MLVLSDFMEFEYFMVDWFFAVLMPNDLSTIKKDADNDLCLDPRLASGYWQESQFVFIGITDSIVFLYGAFVF